MEFAFTISQTNGEFAFMNLAFVKRNGGLNPDEYCEVYSGNVTAKDEETACEGLYYQFNVGERPEGYRGRSMSVSDLVFLTNKQTGEETIWFCDSIGFQNVTRYFEF